MSFWSVQGAQRTSVLLAMLFAFTYQLDDGMDGEQAVPSVTTAKAATVDAPASVADNGEDWDGPDLGTYLCLLACGVVVARQIRKRGKTHVTLS
jgi:hypothetical protein